MRSDSFPSGPMGSSSNTWFYSAEILTCHWIAAELVRLTLLSEKQVLVFRRCRGGRSWMDAVWFVREGRRARRSIESSKGLQVQVDLAEVVGLVLADVEPLAEIVGGSPDKVFIDREKPVVISLLEFG